MTDKFFKLIPFFLISYTLFSQNPQEQKKVIEGYDLIKLQSIEEESAKTFYSNKNNAILLAKKRGWKLTYTDSKGSYYELMKVSKTGSPIYYKTDNISAAVSTRANFLHNGGGLGLDIEGQEMTIHVWDGGVARETHQEYNDEEEESRFSIGDGSSDLNFHAAHVMGTIISSGFDPAAKGMAPKANGVGYNWTNDEAEATSAAAAGMLVSNHSYGYSVRDDEGEPQLPAYFFGGYIDSSRNWDNIMYNAPYYLMVTSAGNDGNDNTANTEPLAENNSYDKLTGYSTVKNNLVVANGDDALINSDGTLNSVTRNSSSSEGPTDDYRIKPDITGNGTSVYSTYDSADDAYNTISGTSMASPNIAGSLLLLQQYHKEIYGDFMRASTLKGLALHTSDNIGLDGPDAKTGWGLMNTKTAAEIITKKGLQSVISEIELTQGSTYSIVVNSNGLEPLLASISWTDLPGTINSGTVNDTTPVLVNDIDIRVLKNTEASEIFMPWKLTSVNTNEKGDNIVDPYERVDVPNASGEYTITISHKGSLVGGAQKVSLIVTGVSSGIALLTNVNSKTSCEDTETFNFNFIETIGGTTSFSVDGVPLNATLDLSNNSLNADGTLTVTFGNLNNVAPGTYKINVNGQNGSEITTTLIELRVISAVFSENEVLPIYPSNGLTGVSSIGVKLYWEKNNNALTYQIEVSESPSFNMVLFSEISNDLSFSLETLQPETVYYWRIKPENNCATGDFSSTYSFQTGVSNCSKTYSASDFSMAIIDTIPNQIAPFVPFNITDNLIIDKVLVTTDITHTYVADMVISLEGPSSTGSNKVVLLSNNCGEGDDINATFNDAANPLTCNASTPAISGAIAPSNNMSLPFSGKDAFGEWKLITNDTYDGDGGQINSASITLCTLETNTIIPSLTQSDIIVEKNTTHTITDKDIMASTTTEYAKFQVFTLVVPPIKGHLEFNGAILSAGDTFNQKEISRGNITYTNTETSSFSDEFKVDIVNKEKGWLPNQTVKIREVTLSLEDNYIEGLVLWPNPVSNSLKIQFKNSDTNEVSIGLFDLQGRQILKSFEASKTNIFTREINVQKIASGIYLLTIQQGNKRTTKKILVSR